MIKNIFNNSISAKVRRWIVFSLIVVLILFTILIIIEDNKAQKKMLDWDFAGIITNIKFNSKGAPDIVVNHKTYFLPSSEWQINFNMQKGDSIVKKAGTITIIVYRKGRMERIVF
ncbi:hypothetical protein [Mucilaginibacter sp. FT3.2]|uniref:hypothetical protein n=1 Tax=Mucilaginibacter sp. FT3.2 TaxID=2723090 RepID=UPI00160F81A2|nr:hypothetical protein [Mucilaginibacter sp. FT3.2]MBB6235182.1 hypothetical protein [Mucilaginibacter sp. FT3.2]